MKKYPDVDGILACNDIVAISTYKILHKKQIHVPEQIQLVGFDDIHLTRLLSPELTTFHQPIREMARRPGQDRRHHCRCADHRRAEQRSEHHERLQLLSGRGQGPGHSGRRSV